MLSNPFVAPIEPITASDDEIRAALEQAEVPPLLPALDTLAAFRDGGSQPAPLPDDETLLRIMEHAVGGAGMSGLAVAHRLQQAGVAFIVLEKNADARAYLGVAIPGFPSLFSLYGPNTNIVINGSIAYFSECGARYVLDLLRLVLEYWQRTLRADPADYEFVD